MTHADLVKVAARWLKRTRRCGVVLSEHHGGSVEIPDAIGFRAWHSIQVECKVSRSDFKADAKKAGRRRDPQASERWYLTPVQLVTLDELPPSWGLLEWDGRIVRQVRAADALECSVESWRTQVLRLYCEVRRYHSQGIKYLTVAQLMAKEAASKPAEGDR